MQGELLYACTQSTFVRNVKIIHNSVQCSISPANYLCQSASINIMDI
jgi:hypothetical protein